MGPAEGMAMERGRVLPHPGEDATATSSHCALPVVLKNGVERGEAAEVCQACGQEGRAGPGLAGDLPWSNQVQPVLSHMKMT